MIVHFIGAGPGAPDLITVRGLELLRRAPVVLYAGSLIPTELVAQARPGARVIDTAPLHLDQIVAEMEAAARAGDDVARLHSGDPALYGAIAEQMRRLDALGIAYDITPGVPAYAAAAAVLGSELTLPGVSQTVVLTRTATRGSAMPDNEQLAAFAATGATLAVHLSINNLARVCRELIPQYGPDCPAIVAYRVSWPDQQILRGTLADIGDRVKGYGITRTALILVGRVFGESAFADSRLYAADHHHVLRPPISAASATADCRRVQTRRKKHL
jgi:precorrin-4/cobalt-precorrin-4 C11-methyltransferase